MQIIQRGSEAQQLVFSLRGQGKTVGVVPTMGALHEGHLSLVRLVAQMCDHTVVSVFVNPTQFAPHEDLQKYPRTLEADCEALDAAGADVVFAPPVDEMYPSGYSTFVEPPNIALPLEGVFRPGHFRGVTTVVLKLFQLLPGTHAIFGSKDYQQLKVIEAMVRDLNVGIEIVAGETIREPDGLALSSRNRFLSPDERISALSLSQALSFVESRSNEGERNVKELEQEMRSLLSAVTSTDYAAIVDAETLLPITHLDRPAQALIAAHVGATRLIDNRRIGDRVSGK